VASAGKIIAKRESQSWISLRDAEEMQSWSIEARSSWAKRIEVEGSRGGTVKSRRNCSVLCFWGALTRHPGKPALAPNYRDHEKIFLPRVFILIRPRDMKCAPVIVLVSIAFVSQAFGVLRPLFPAKSSPPFNGGAMTIGDHWIGHSSKSAPGTATN
jgi:hypothetical protein